MIELISRSKSGHQLKCFYRLLLARGGNNKNYKIYTQEQRYRERLEYYANQSTVSRRSPV